MGRKKYIAVSRNLAIREGIPREFPLLLLTQFMQFTFALEEQRYTTAAMSVMRAASNKLAVEGLFHMHLCRAVTSAAPHTRDLLRVARELQDRSYGLVRTVCLAQLQVIWNT